MAHRNSFTPDPVDPWGDPYDQPADPWATNQYDPPADPVARGRHARPSQQPDPWAAYASSTPSDPWGNQTPRPSGHARFAPDPYNAAAYQPTRQIPHLHGAAPAQASPRRRPPRRSKAPLIAAIVLLIAGLALVVYAGYVFVGSQQEYQAGIEEYQEVAQASVTEEAVTGRPVVDFAALKQQNHEIVGWIQIPNTPVNYPVCQTANNEYYLDHTFLGQYNLAGTVFMDYRSAANLSSYNTVLYGHHLKNGEMFAKIAEYSNQAAFDTIQNIYYVGEDGQVHVLVALCCMVVDGYDVDSIRFDFASQADFESYVQSLIDRSSARSATASAVGVERIYMLSTCSYASENDRTVLVCVDLAAGNGPVVDATQNLGDIQSAADAVAAIA